MKAFMTNGTLAYLQKKEKENDVVNFFYMVNEGKILAYYEHETVEVFEMAREFEILSNLGDFKEIGFVAMNHIPASPGSEPIIESQFRHRQHLVDEMPGFQAFRFLKPAKGQTYIVITQWDSKKDFENWTTSPEFIAAHKKEVIKPSAHAPERPFLKTYKMYEEDEDELDEN